MGNGTRSGHRALGAVGPLTGPNPRLLDDHQRLKHLLKGREPGEPVLAGHGSGSSNGRAWARRRISSTIADAIVMAFPFDRARSDLSSAGPQPVLSPPRFSVTTVTT
jgi:hypothetical protein